MRVLYPDDNHAIRRISNIEASDGLRPANENTRTNQQEDADRDLRDDERVSQPGGSPIIRELAPRG